MAWIFPQCSQLNVSNLKRTVPSCNSVLPLETSPCMHVTSNLKSKSRVFKSIKLEPTLCPVSSRSMDSITESKLLLKMLLSMSQKIFSTEFLLMHNAHIKVQSNTWKSSPKTVSNPKKTTRSRTNKTSTKQNSSKNSSNLTTTLTHHNTTKETNGRLKISRNVSSTPSSLTTCMNFSWTWSETASGCWNPTELWFTRLVPLITGRMRI